MAESIMNVVKKLQKDQNILGNKIIKLTEAFKTRVVKIEKKMAEYENKRSNEHKELDSRVVKLRETLTEDIENLMKNEVKLSDIVSTLETERKHVTNNIHLIDIALSTVMDKLETLEVKVNEEHESKESKERKVCAFHNRGYCKEKNCPFCHADLVCQIYKNSVKCGKQNCRLRHPKISRYEFQCYRGESCRYLHHTLPCGRCESFSKKCYYCEFCKKSFCDSCTVDQAHIKNIYDNENSEHPNCKSIHIDLGCDQNSCTGTLNL